jgi:DNA topoisomerase-3
LGAPDSDLAQVGDSALGAIVEVTAPAHTRAARGKTTRKPKFNGSTVSASPSFSRHDVGRNTPLKIPYGNKEIALKLGARYAAGGWYAPPGVDLSAFKENGWL